MQLYQTCNLKITCVNWCLPSLSRCVVLPIIHEFNPDMILVSAGFNATEGHPNTLGGYSVTPACKLLIIWGNALVPVISLRGLVIMEFFDFCIC